MSNKKIEIEVKDLKGLYDILTNYPQISKEQVECEMKKVFGEDVFKPADIRDRIKTFHDAYCALGNDHPFVVSYEKYVNAASGEEADVIAFLQLRIIAAALNEGWKPKFTTDEWRYYPYFYLVTNDEIEKMDEDERSRVVLRSSNVANANGGIVCAHAYNDSSVAFTYHGSRLAFKNRDLAIYAGQQFIDIYANFCFPTQE